MNSNNKLPQQQPPIQQKPTSSFKWIKPFTLIAIVLFVAVIAGAARYLPEKRNNYPIPSSQPEPSPQKAMVIKISATIDPFTSPLPLTEGKQSQAYMWKTYTSESLGVSFQYPTNLEPVPSRIVVNVNEFNNSVDIRYRLTYIFRITKLTTNQSLLDWVESKNMKDNSYISKRIVTQTTFHGYPAYSVEQIPENIEDQVPMDLYIVKVSPTTLYEIQYEIPDPRYTQGDAQEHYLFTAGMKKILDSIMFITNQ